MIELTWEGAFGFASLIFLVIGAAHTVQFGIFKGSFYTKREVDLKLEATQESTDKKIENTEKTINENIKEIKKDVREIRDKLDTFILALK